MPQGVRTSAVDVLRCEAALLRRFVDLSKCIEAIGKSSPDIRFERKRVYLGDGHFVSEYQMSATNAEGQLLVCDGVDVFVVDDGRVARKDTYLDWPALQEQQGAAPVSAISA